MKKLVISLILLSGFVSTAAIAADLKIGVVNVEKIFTGAPQIKAINTSMLERFGPQRDDLQKAEKEITAMQENYKQNELVMAEDKLNQLNQLKKKIITKIQMLKQKETMLAQEVATVRKQEITVLRQQIKGVIDDIAKKGKYSLVLSDGIAYSDESFDITSQVLDKLKAAFKNK